MKLNTSPRVASQDVALTRELREHAQQTNAISEGRLSGAYNAQATAPTDGTYALGDFVRNSAPAELGSSPNKYVVFGWINVAAGTPGTFVQMRLPTGN